MSLWTLASVAATVYRIFADGRRDTIRPLFSPAKWILVSDRAGGFTFWSMGFAPNLFCASSARTYGIFATASPAGALGCELLESTALVFEYWHGYKDGIPTRQELEYWLRPARRGLERALERGEKAKIERLSGACADILSFGSQSERAEHVAERMMTVVPTARKQGKTVLDFLVRALTARINGTVAPQLLGEHEPA
jgi:hypothetical protein